MADNICHELAHQWFGNLVTMQWWDELWLNEGFATWVAHYAVDQIFPDWGIWGTFANGRGEDAFRADGLRGGHPVHIPFEDGTQLHEIFDEISYGKGCAVIRMLVAYVGGETFFKGVSEYLKANLYRNATGDALWKALDAASGKDVGGLAHSWLNIVGYPVVKVEEDVERGDITLTQSRFLTSGDVKPEDDTTVWQLPLGITGVPPGQEDMILKTRHTTISGVAMSLYTVNTNGTGFYRVAYPSARLAKLTTQLHRLSNEDKIAILGSVTALAAAGNGSPTSVLKFLQAFKDETEYAVWVSVVETLQTIGEAFDEDAQIRAGLKQFELRLVEGTVDKLLKEGPPGGEFMKKILWRLMLNRAAVCGHARYANWQTPLPFVTFAPTNCPIGRWKHIRQSLPLGQPPVVSWTLRCAASYSSPPWPKIPPPRMTPSWPKSLHWPLAATPWPTPSSPSPRLTPRRTWPMSRRSCSQVPSAYKIWSAYSSGSQPTPLAAQHSGLW